MLRFTANLIAQLTRECNLKCPHCYEGHSDTWKGKAIDHEMFKQVLDMSLYQRNILGRIEAPFCFHFHGGEVLLRPFEEIKKDIEYLKERRKFFPGLTYCIQTNGINITDEVAQYFAANNVSIGFSFDGYENDRMSKDATIELINKLRGFHEKYGTSFSALSVLSKKNMKYWYEDACSITDFVDSVGINVMCCTEDKDEELMPSAEDQWKYWIEPVLKSWLTDKPFHERDLEVVLIKLMQQIIFGISTVEQKTGCFDRACGHGANMISIDPTLKCCGCDKYLEDGPYFFNKVGKDFRARDFLGLQQAKYTVHHYIKLFEEEKKLNCDLCPMKLCCPGECQAINLSKYNKVRLTNDMCEVYLRLYDFIMEHWWEIAQHYPLKTTETIKEITPFAHRVFMEKGLRLAKTENGNYYYVAKKEENK